MAACPPASWHRRSLSSTLMEESVAAAAAVVHRWHPDASCSLFLHSGDHAAEQFLGATADLHRAMVFFASDADNTGIVQAQELLQTAMRRLDLELRLLLDQDLDDTASIRAVADTMMSTGYGKECLATFKSVRRAKLATKLSCCSYTTSSNTNKLGWEQVDTNLIQPWLAAAPVAFGSLFAEEKELCDSVFAGGAVAEAVFAGIVTEQATSLVVVAEAAVARARRAPERLFRVLDVHDTLADLLPAIMSVFGDSSEIPNRAALVVTKAAEAARGTLLSFEAAIHKEPSSSSKQADGGVHPLTRYVMNYLVFLADYQSIQPAIGNIGDHLVLALLSKLESKAGSYREPALSYLFLANNTHYVATKVSGSSRLQAILGECWAEEHSAKARAHAEVYVRAAWGKVLAMITSSSSSPPTDLVEEAVMAAVAMQDQWTAADEEMGEVLRAAATAAVIPKYRMFYRRYGAALRLTPGDVTTMIAALFNGRSTNRRFQ